MARSPKCLAVTLAALLPVLLAWASVARADRPAVVGPGDSIQAAVDAADPGDTIVVFGTHRENVAVQTDRLTLRGVGALLLPPATPAASACFDPTEVGEAVHGICVIGDVDFTTGEVNRYVERVKVSGFTIRDFAGGGALVAVGARDTTFTRNVAHDNDDGMQSAKSFGTRVVSNRASGGRFGVRIFSSLGGRIAGNALHGNCVGAIVIGSSLGTAGDLRIAGNAVRRNTRACPGDEDFPALSGIGIGLLGATATAITGNLITGNVPSGESAASGGVVAIGGPDGTPLTDNRVRGNVILANEPDILWDESGTGNVFRPNVCRTSIPPDLCGGRGRSRR
jgi:nitrous oxidase accessory protein NosD